MLIHWNKGNKKKYIGQSSYKQLYIRNHFCFIKTFVLLLIPNGQKDDGCKNYSVGTRYRYPLWRTFHKKIINNVSDIVLAKDNCVVKKRKHVFSWVSGGYGSQERTKKRSHFLKCRVSEIQPVKRFGTTSISVHMVTQIWSVRVKTSPLMIVCKDIHVDPNWYLLLNITFSFFLQTVFGPS